MLDMRADHELHIVFMKRQTCLAALIAASCALSGGLVHANATVSGVVHFAGNVPPSAPITAVVPPACGTAPIHDESIVASNKKIANVVVWLEGGAAKASPSTIVLDQKGCHYEPHVQVAPVGSKITITNSDAALHTAHAYNGAVSMWNVATPTAGSKTTKDLVEPGPVHFKCDAGHVWMSAWVYVTDSPLSAVTAADGSWKIADVPAGSYTVHFWHEKLGDKTAKVTVDGTKSPAPLTIDYK